MYGEEIIDHRLLKCERKVNEALGSIDFVEKGTNVVAFRTCEQEQGHVVFQMGTSDAVRALKAAQIVMEGDNVELSSEAKERIIRLFRDSMTRLAKFEELADVGSRLLQGYRQGLEFLRRPPIKKSDVVEKIIKANETERLKSYFGEKSKCINTSDALENINKLNACDSGLKDHLTRAKAIVTELEMLVEETATATLCTKEVSILLCKAPNDMSDAAAAPTRHEESVSPPSPAQSSEASELEYALMTGIICSMVRQEYAMQEKIVTSLNFKVSSEELESYCLMWSIRPNINDDIMRMAWKLIR
uniref:DUF7795 domain-containing protein n=2 Tax=Kalanchoe fedtschenkoi TaxID=63787 RepID=A0A7N0TMB5_KALFE